MTHRDILSQIWIPIPQFNQQIELDSALGRIRFGSRPLISHPEGVQLYLVRHGETLANQKKIFQGSDQETEWTQLSAEGKIQSQRAAAMLAKKLEAHHAGAAVHVISSPAQRARHTAEDFIKELGAKFQIRFELLECLHEIRFGEMSGKTEEEIRAMGPQQTRFIEEYRYRANATVSAGSSESFLKVMERVHQGLAAWIKQLEQGKPQVVVFYTHMITGAAIRTVFGDLSLKEQDAESGEFVRWRQMLGNAEPHAWNSATHAFEKIIS